MPKPLLITLACTTCILISSIIVWIIWGNSALIKSDYRISSGYLPHSFDGFVIAQVSDLHNCEFGKHNENLLNLLRDAKPDVIAITGDFVDSRRTNIAVSIDFVKQAVKIAPCYYVTGNHESRISQYPELKQALITAGVTVLDDQCQEIELAENKINIIGLNDPKFSDGDERKNTKAKLQSLVPDNDNFTILLTHRPELFDLYVNAGIDLILAGHAHGGQIRLPALGGVIAPNQGLFPKYDAGMFQEENSQMIVSRGLCDTVFPPRINNKPELVVISLTS